jgi:alkylation response protein AidB-like acyl-CoA dehydrogenase
VLLLVEAGQPGLALEHAARVDGGFWGELQFKGVEVGAAQLVAGAARPTPCCSARSTWRASPPPPNCWA